MAQDQRPLVKIPNMRVLIFCHCEMICRLKIFGNLFSKCFDNLKFMLFALALLTFALCILASGQLLCSSTHVHHIPFAASTPAISAQRRPWGGKILHHHRNDRVCWSLQCFSFFMNKGCFCYSCCIPVGGRNAQLFCFPTISENEHCWRQVACVHYVPVTMLPCRVDDEGWNRKVVTVQGKLLTVSLLPHICWHMEIYGYTGSSG